ncbi:hypothetical protein DND58_29325 [Pseudomonas syringae pv. pisi]|nr:hypothetical protein DND58_29325 [Pseudomonas syringae pv. pisi]
MFSCSKSEQKQLNTWVSFQSAEQPLLGQFSVSDNSPGGACILWRRLYPTCLRKLEKSLPGPVGQGPS